MIVKVLFLICSKKIFYVTNLNPLQKSDYLISYLISYPLCFAAYPNREIKSVRKGKHYPLRVESKQKLIWKNVNSYCGWHMLQERISLQNGLFIWGRYSNVRNMGKMYYFHSSLPSSQSIVISISQQPYEAGGGRNDPTLWIRTLSIREITLLSQILFISICQNWEYIYFFLLLEL